MPHIWEGGDYDMKPFAKSRKVVSWAHMQHRYGFDLARCQCPPCKLAFRLSGDSDDFRSPHTGYCYATVSRLDFSQEEKLETTLHDIHTYFSMVAQELQHPLTMGFRGAT